MRIAILALCLLPTALPLVTMATQLHPQPHPPQQSNHRQQRSLRPSSQRQQRPPLLILPTSLDDCAGLAAKGLDVWRKGYEACLSLLFSGEGRERGGVEGQKMLASLSSSASPGFVESLVRSASSSPGVLTRGFLRPSTSASAGFLKDLVRSAGSRYGAAPDGVDVPGDVFAGVVDSTPAERKRSDKDDLAVGSEVIGNGGGGEAAVKESELFSNTNNDDEARTRLQPWQHRQRDGRTGGDMLKKRRSNSRAARSGQQQSGGLLAFRRRGRGGGMGGAEKYSGDRTRRRHVLSVNSALDSLADMMAARDYSRSRARQQAFREQLLDLGR